MKNVKKFLTSQRGINTVEVVIILAVVVGLAVIFRERIGGFANRIMNSVFGYEGDLTIEGVKTIPPSP